MDTTTQLEKRAKKETSHLWCTPHQSTDYDYPNPCQRKPKIRLPSIVVYLCRAGRYAANWTFFFFSIERTRAPGFAASRALAITLAPVVGGGYQFPRRCDPPILPTAHKTIIVAECIRLWRRYNPSRTCSVRARSSRMDTPAKANFTPRRFIYTHCARSARDIYYDNFYTQKRFAVIYIRSWN